MPVKRLDGVQMLRAVAVLLVAWLHAGQQLGDWRVKEVPHFSAFGIDIFFVISGFIMSWGLLRSRQAPGVATAWEFLKRRLIRIYPIYWLFAIVNSARLLHGHGFFLQNYFPSFLLLPGLYPRYPLVVAFSWTMVFEMLFYYLLSAVLLVTLKRAVPVFIALLAAAVLVGDVVGVRDPTWTPFSSPLLLEFVFGAIVALIFLRFGQRTEIGMGVLLIGVISSFYLRAHPEQGGAAGIAMAVSSVGAMRHVMTWGLAAASIVAGVIFWSPRIQGLSGRAVISLGNASYSSYLASAIVLEFSVRILIPLGGRSSVAKEVLFQAVMVLTVLVAGSISYKFVESPVIRWMQDKL